MLSIADAYRLIDTHLGDTPRARHSVEVGRLMRELARLTRAEPTIWHLAGLCHDLDYEAVGGDWSRHGLLAAEWLGNDLPTEALDAIRAHDHRTGIIADTPVALALKLADAVAIAHDAIGPNLAILLAGNPAALASRLAGRPYLPAMIVANAGALGIELPGLAMLLARPAIVLRPATPDSLGFDTLLEASVREDHRMLLRFSEAWRDGSNRFDRPGEAMFGAFLNDRLVGLCGRNRDPYDPAPRAGRVRHLYVLPGWRRSGVGRLLLDAVVDGAAEWFDYLNTNCPPEAAPFYERLGFVPFAADRITHRLPLA